MISPIASVVASPTGVVETAMVEIGGVVSVEDRAIVFEIDPVAIVTTPGRIIIVGISGEFRFTDCRGGIVTPGINRSGSRSIDNGCGSCVCRTHINVRNGDAYADVCSYEDLRITFAGDEAGGYNGGGKDK